MLKLKKVRNPKSLSLNIKLPRLRVGEPNPKQLSVVRVGSLNKITAETQWFIVGQSWDEMAGYFWECVSPTFDTVDEADAWLDKELGIAEATATLIR